MSHSRIPVKVIQAIGDEATKELYEDIDQRDQEIAATKVDRTEYDAHMALIAEKFQHMEDKIDARFEISNLRFDKKISDAKRETIIWTVGLLTAVMGVWSAVIVGLLK